MPAGEPDPTDVRAGEVLEILRRLRGWTITELAGRAQMSRTTINDKRAGRKAWTLADTECFAAVFDVPAAVFLMDEETFRSWRLSVGRVL